MASFNEGKITKTVGTGGVSKDQLVKLDGATVVVAGSDEYAIGTALSAGSAGDLVAVRLLNTGGTFKMIAGEAFAAAADLYTGADGKVVDTDPGVGTVRYVALEAATADGDVVEVLPK